MTLLQRGFVKSAQLINQTVKMTESDAMLQFNINQVNPAKSIVLFDGDMIWSSGGYDGEMTNNYRYAIELYSIESNCVKFRSNDGYSERYPFFHIPFQVVEFY